MELFHLMPFLGVLLTTLFGAVGACDGRTYLNSSYGVITDGVGKYLEASHCEWLIEASGNNKFITLDFISMETECAYDYLFIYDGNSYTSPLLGSFSGSTLPDRVLASSGNMLIYFFSDRNYVRIGFNANFSTTACPHNCSNHGDCNTISRQCLCYPGYTGHACELQNCPDNCGTHGQCNTTLGRCVCDEGYIGDRCNFSLNAKSDFGAWTPLFPAGSGFSARTGHGGVFINGCLYVFGGSTLNVFLDDLLTFCLGANRWESIPKSESLEWPEGRHGHAVAAHQDSFFMFGGVKTGNVFSDELWKFDTNTSTWTLIITANNAAKPQGLSSHTFTNVDDQWLYLFGGQRKDEEFISDMYRIDANNPASWEIVVSVGGKKQGRRLSGHSAVYHKLSRSILILGGFTPDYARFPKRTNLLHAFHVDQHHWSQINYALGESQDPLLERAFHSASIIGNYLIVVGGNAHIHHRAELCFDGDVYFYHLGCHKWVTMDNFKPYSTHRSKSLSARSQNTEPPKGRFSHVAAVPNDNVILVSGGYRGNVLGDLMAYTVPKTVTLASGEDQAERCGHLRSYDGCVGDPECVWCGQTDVCLHRSDAESCEGSVHYSDCPGICATLRNCGSCAVLGQGSSTANGNHGDTGKGLWVNDQCAWCVKEQQCQKRTELEGACNPSEGTVSGIQGWWGNMSALVTSLDRCRLEDRPAGLHLIKYRYPPNFTNPDEVDIIRETLHQFQFVNTCEAELELGGEYTVEFRGFVHPLDAVPYGDDPYLQVYMTMSGGQGWLNISTDQHPYNQEEVASLNAATYLNFLARRPDEGPIFPNTARSSKYYFLERGVQKIAVSGTTQVTSSLRAEWTATVDNSEQSRQPLTSEFLEPYTSYACDDHDTCLACLTNAACGWCDASDSCVQREATGLSAAHCGLGGPLSGGPPPPTAGLLVYNQTECVVCSDHLDCNTCTGTPHCEWLTTETRCFRRGRFAAALTDPQTCPADCESRTNCSSCISDKNECAWCEQTNTCFPFMAYILRYAYGGCTYWVDAMSSQRCHDCTRHTVCKDCLAELQCGWCGSRENPTVGTCVHGDFTGPDSDGNHGNCSALISEAHNTSVTEPADWSYGVCPDVEECRLGYHDCHDNATCYNTFDYFECHCNQGFEGDGRESCERTCYYKCYHGNCSGAPLYQCQCHVGWTGEQCDINCGCNNHSYCGVAVGTCDDCMDHTMGDHCEMCAVGSYGDATSDLGCTPCPCNDHADPSRGLCHNVTGLCYCTDNTEGDQCQYCKPGFYGDPRDGGRCYLRCDGRMILGNITEGYLGTEQGSGVMTSDHVYCLWILTVYEDVGKQRMLDVMPTITFTMETDIKTVCGRDYVYVFDGIPSFVSPDPASWAPLLGAYCGYGLSEPLSVEATSGYLTVYYEANMGSSSTRGFNASYHINDCPTRCRGNRVCRGDSGSHCDCDEGYSGVDCAVEVCPDQCSVTQGQGECDLELGYCNCHYGYADDSCNSTVTDHSATYLPINDPWRRDGIGAFSSTKAHMGHTIATCDGQNVLMYGGLSSTDQHLEAGIVWKYNVLTDKWDLIRPVSAVNPTNRYFHSAVCLSSLHAMFIFGGLVTDGDGDTHKVKATNEVWKFSLDSYRWTLLETPLSPPPMAGHTMTVIDATKSIIIGGFSTDNYFSDAHYQFDAANLNWVRLAFNGVMPTGVYGHSAVFHSSSNTIYVYGGHEYQTDKMAASSNLYALDLRNERWSILPANHGNQPVQRAFHTAVDMDDYMVVIGGATSDADFDGTVWAYRYRCNHWVDVSPGVAGVLGTANTAVRGAAALKISGAIYHVGGFSGLMHATVTRVTLPEDLCALNRDRAACTSMLGCNLCMVRETNDTYCYDKSMGQPQGCQPQNHENMTVIHRLGTACDKDLVEKRACSHHTSCSKCLANWPIHKDHDENVCKWCSNCPQGMCVRQEADCDRANPCERTQRVISSPTDCVERLCQAADCAKCAAQGSCMWTRQFKRSSEVGRTLSLMPIYNWNCVTKSLLEATPYKIQSSPPSECPRRCHEHATCSECLASLGGEGGAQECAWGVTVGECLPPAYLPLRCASGSCGHIQSGPPSNCPQPCSVHMQCRLCLAAPGCGWCALGQRNGLGVCMEGGLLAPLKGKCEAGDVMHGTGPLSESQKLWVRDSQGPPTWAFVTCPAEDECMNGHHSCDQSEDCTDLVKGYRCDCKHGYRRHNSTGRCSPYCRAGCEPHGTCVRPDVCECHFGYVGHNCTTECLCNRHSDCRSVLERDVCLACQNNTRGPRCSMCKPLYVGNPVSGGRCRSCVNVCHQHSAVCLSQEDLNRTMIFRTLPLDPYNVTRWVHSGSKQEDKAVCMHCANNTQGTHCDECKPGYYRLGSQPITDPCALCQCQGHSDTCDKTTGTNCDCKNNTKSPRCDPKQPDKKCHLIQCSECLDNFMGTPTQGHQCYRQMAIDHDYCLDPITQSDCYREPRTLAKGQTVFFVVPPKYLNVDIRVTIDVTRGGLNLFLANLDNTFKVAVNQTNNEHEVNVDESLLMADYQEILAAGKTRNTRDITTGHHPHNHRDFPDFLKRHFERKSRQKRDDDEDDDSRESSRERTDSRNGTSEIQYKVKVYEAKGINTFITLDTQNTLLAVSGLKNRLVITIPSQVHDLKNTVFYFVIQGVGDPVSTNESLGLIFFRQDQPHIDLFVFFSVFFSSFFLFLDLCVIVWKVKQAVDTRRSRQRRQVEMASMASRPFSKSLVVLESEASWPPVLETQTLLRKSNHRMTLPKFGSKYSLGATNMAFVRTQSDETLRINPLALEPMDDGVAAVGSFFFELPGGSTAPVRACIGSTLLTMRVMYPTASSHAVAPPVKHHRRCAGGTL